jgi:SAM-dependent methyltransferase
LNKRLYPDKYSGRYFILTQLRKINEQIVDEIIQYKTDLIDYGCGSAPYRDIYLKKVRRYDNSDFENNVHANIQLNKLGIIPADNSLYDYVLSTQVLEHVENVDLYLNESYRVLKKGGLLILSTHGYWKYHPDPEDYWRWTKVGLIKTLEKAGFKVEKTYGIMGLAASGLQLFQDAISRNKNRVFKSILFRIINFLQHISDNRSFDYNDAAVYLIIAKK